MATEHVKEARGRFGTQTTEFPVASFGADRLDAEAFSKRLADAFLEACLKPPSDARCVGLGDIRYLQSDIADELFPAYLDFLQSAFPGAALIFNVRNIADTAGSGWWRDRNRKTVTEQLIRAVERFKSYAATRSNCIVFSCDFTYCRPDLLQVFVRFPR